MKHYAVTLFGNRTGATIDKDYKVAECTTYAAARALIDSNGKWGNVREFNTYHDALEANIDFILEIRAHGLSCTRVK
jgi:hypothetical protein